MLGKKEKYELTPSDAIFFLAAILSWRSFHSINTIEGR
jgi:hypothetical protein